MHKISKVAADLAVHANTVRRWIRIGEVEAVRTPGGHYRVPTRELHRLLESA